MQHTFAYKHHHIIKLLMLHLNVKVFVLHVNVTLSIKYNLKPLHATQCLLCY